MNANNPNAFPCDYSDRHEGMTLRDYFAAHAPNEIPVWFQAKLTPFPERHKDAKFCNGCLTEFQDCEQTISCLKAHEHKNLENKIRDIQKMERMIQWRFAYADSMLNEREKGEK